MKIAILGYGTIGKGVYEIVSIANVIGKRFGVIQLMKDGELYGPLSVKPLSLFKVKNY